MTEPTDQPTIQQHLADLERWLKERNLAITPCVRGLRTGALAPVEDYLPETHAATWALQVAAPKT